MFRLIDTYDNGCSAGSSKEEAEADCPQPSYSKTVFLHDNAHCESALVPSLKSKNRTKATMFYIAGCTICAMRSPCHLLRRRPR